MTCLPASSDEAVTSGVRDSPAVSRIGTTVAGQLPLFQIQPKPNRSTEFPFHSVVITNDDGTPNVLWERTTNSHGCKVESLTMRIKRDLSRSHGATCSVTSKQLRSRQSVTLRVGGTSTVTSEQAWSRRSRAYHDYCNALTKPLDDIKLALIRPCLGNMTETAAYWILSNIFPFFFVVLSFPHLRVPEGSLPNRLFITSRPRT